MADAAARAAERGIRSMVGFTYRRVPAVTFLRDLIAEGVVGTVQQVRAAYRQDWLVDPEMPLAWRLQKEHAGSGALGDIGAHIIDMTQFVTGQTVDAVSGTIDTIVKERPLLGSGSGLSGTAGEGFGEVTVDDVALFTGRLSNGALVSFEATRFATGRKNALTIEVSGDKGALAFDLEDLNSLQFYDRTAPGDRQGFTKILVTEAQHPYVAAWWPAGHMLGYEHGFSSPGRRPRDRDRRGHRPASVVRRGSLGAARARCRRALERERVRLDPHRRGRRPPVVERAKRDETLRQPDTPAEGEAMTRPITLFTGQWADLPFEEVARLAGEWGYDGLEIACWGDHLDVARWDDAEYVRVALDILERNGLKVYTISNHLTGQAVCDDPIDERHRDILSDRVWGDGDPEGVRQRAART